MNNPYREGTDQHHAYAMGWIDATNEATMKMIKAIAKDLDNERVARTIGKATRLASRQKST